MKTETPGRFSGETKEKEPEILFHFFYSEHETSKDFEKLEEAFKKCDIYVPEAFRWDPNQLEELRRVSRGEISPKESGFEAPNGSARLRQLEFIYKSDKPILIADVPLTNTKLTGLRERANPHFGKALEFFQEGLLKEALLEYYEFLELMSEFSLARENFIKENLEREISVFLDSNDEYKIKKELKVLIALGAGHTAIYQDLKSGKSAISQEFSHLPHVFDLRSEALRRIMFNREVSDDLLAHAIIEIFLEEILEKLSDNTQKIGRISRMLISSLNISDIEEISKDFGQNPDLDIISALENVGVKVPRSEKEMDILLKQKERK